MTYLVDANFLIALLHSRHAFSGRAVRWLDSQETQGSVLLCRVAQMAALRILTNPVWLKEDVLAASAVWEGWDILLTDSRFTWAQEPAGLEREWRLLTRDLPSGRCAETDSYFAAFARAGGHCLLTFDRGFRRFSGLEVEILD